MTVRHVRIRLETGAPLCSVEADVAVLASQHLMTCSNKVRSAGVHQYIERIYLVAAAPKIRI